MATAAMQVRAGDGEHREVRLVRGAERSRTLNAAAAPPMRFRKSAFVPRNSLCPPMSTASTIAAIMLMRGSNSMLTITAANATGISSG